MRLTDLSLQDVAILGVGREGLAVRRALRAINPRLALTYFAESDADGQAAAQLDHPLDTLHIGGLNPQQLTRHAVLVRSPGISPYRPELREAVRLGCQITTASNIWFAENPQARTICITGTKGKSTTTALTAHLLRAAGLRVQVAGNIGQAMLDLPGAKVDWWVLELSSYQLADLQARPTVAAILNVSDEHLDWHDGSANYRRDKLRLAGFSGIQTVVANWEDITLKAALSAQNNVCWFNHANGFHVTGHKLVQPAGEIPGLPLAGLPGDHNLANIAAALTIADAVGVPVSDVAGSLADFQGLPHRLCSLGSRAGVRYVDDSLATTPVATLAALQAFSGTAVTLLVGGLSRGLDWSSYADNFKALLPYAIIGIPDNGPDIIDTLSAAGLRPPGGLHLADDLRAAVELAKNLTPDHGMVLLSPGAPSFPRFVDYRDRGRQFAGFAGFQDGV